MARRHRKRAWNASNPLYRYLHRGGKRTTRRRGNMARRHRRYGRKGGSRGGSIMGLSTRGLVGGLGLLGVAGAAFFSDQIAQKVPIDVPYKNYAVAFAIGGPAGVAAKVAKDALMGGTGSSGAW